MLHAVLLGDAFEDKLGRVLTGEERQDLQQIGAGPAFAAIEAELDAAMDASAAAAILARIRSDRP